MAHSSRRQESQKIFLRDLYIVFLLKARESYTHIANVFFAQAEKYGSKVAFYTWDGNQESAHSYTDLKRGVLGVAAQLYPYASEHRTALLVYQDTIAFTVAFLACQLCGIVAIPTLYPRNKRQIERLDLIASDANTRLVLCEAGDRQAEKVRNGLQLTESGAEGILLELDHQHNVDIVGLPPATEEPLAFIQYTSGSTSRPKGVMVSHKSLLDNERLLQETFGCDQHAVIVSWLPFYHDMGLIGNLLHTLFTGATGVLLPSASVVQNPMLWLQAIEKYRGTHSGGPNFMYDLCAEKATQLAEPLDLSSWQVAYNGSEPVKAKTRNKFIAAFAGHRFVHDSFKTCYGLAEATLLVAAGVPKVHDGMLSSGEVHPAIDLCFYDHETQSIHEQRGEICLCGESITSGYWARELPDLHVSHEGNRFLRTGDEGFIKDGHLYVTGRLKEMIILRGQNIYPYDIEDKIAATVEGVLTNGVALTHNEEEGLMVFAETERGLAESQWEDVIRMIDKVLLDETGEASENLFLLTPRRIPRTSSGKLQRARLLQFYIQGDLKIICDKKALLSSDQRDIGAILEAIDQEGATEANLKNYLWTLLMQTLLLSEDERHDIGDKSLVALGLSSLKATELVNRVNGDLNIIISVQELFEFSNISEVCSHISDLLWLKNEPTDGEEIEI